jgi:hypothetical protein
MVVVTRVKAKLSKGNSTKLKFIGGNNFKPYQTEIRSTLEEKGWMPIAPSLLFLFYESN